MKCIAEPMAKSKLSITLKLLSIVALIGMSYAVYQTVSEAGYRETATNELPKLEIWIRFMDFNPNERTITYRLQVTLWTTGNVSQVVLIAETPFDSKLHLLKNEGRFGPNMFSYGNITKPIEDKIIGRAESFPYDVYWTTLRCNLYDYSQGVSLKFPEGYKPEIYTYIEYPQNLGWQASVSSSVMSSEGLSRADVTITRSPGSSLVIMLPIWAANVILAAALFLRYDPRKRNESVLNNRLMLCISLFVFVPSLTFTIATQIPTRGSTSAAETLLAAVLVNTTILLGTSLMANRSSEYKKWDRSFVFLSALSLIFLLLFFPVVTTIDLVRSGFFRLEFISFIDTVLKSIDFRMVLWLALLVPVYVIPYTILYFNSDKWRYLVYFAGAVVFIINLRSDHSDPTLSVMSLVYVALALFTSRSSFSPHVKKISASIRNMRKTQK